MDQIQTIVVHVDQLTPENMLELSQAGYRVIRDPSLLIFGRNLPNAPVQEQAQTILEEAQGLSEVIPALPTPITKGNKHNRG